MNEYPIVDTIWEKGVGLFKKNHKYKGRPDIIIAEWPKNIFKNKIVNRIWEMFLSFVVWEIWKTWNLKNFENKK